MFTQLDQRSAVLVADFVGETVHGEPSAESAVIAADRFPRFKKLAGKRQRDLGKILAVLNERRNSSVHTFDMFFCGHGSGSNWFASAQPKRTGANAGHHKR